MSYHSQGNSARNNPNHIPSNSNNRALPIRLCGQPYGGLGKRYERNNQSERETANTWDSRQVAQEPDGRTKDESRYSPREHAGVIQFTGDTGFQSGRGGGTQVFEHIVRDHTDSQP
ncbi:hypothetical protein AB0G49_06400 [Streptomyces longwoodensis]|uniref:hypothetical protein n=1 Tax=Streptomyces longwoodensis TaxID=68231 RepID=UPI0034113D14